MNILAISQTLKAMRNESKALKADALPALKAINPSLKEIDVVMGIITRFALH